MTIKDKTIVCKDCGRSFIFRSEEQDFFAEKGYSEPTRCKDCRAARKANVGQSGGRPSRDGGGRPTRDSAGGRFPEREMFTAICAACGKHTQVPFKPREGRPVYCSDCFSRQR